jgi:hypothetical protein
VVGDLRDKAAYGSAMVALGLALVTLLLGICWVAAQHEDLTETFTHECPLGESVHCRPPVYTHTVPHTHEVPKELWYALAILGGVFVGVLVPFSFPGPTSARSAAVTFRERQVTRDALFLVATVGVLGLGIALTALLSKGPLLSFALAGLLLGFLIPSPARGD